MNEPLAGIRVLDLTRNVAGPFASMILAELGADVIKVEMPGRGDDARLWGPPFWGGESPAFLTINRNKKSLALDLSHLAARSVMERAVDRADVLIESFRSGALDKMGFGHGWAATRNPRIVYCSVTAYGERGPLMALPGYDPIMQAFTGIMSVTGTPGGPAVRAGVSLVDLSTGMWAALGVITALMDRDRTGSGSRVGVSLYETALSWMANAMTQYWASGVVPGKFGSGTSFTAPYESFATADGNVMIAAGNDGLFARLSDALGHPEWSSDNRFRRVPDRVINRDALHAVIEQATARLQSDALTGALRSAGVPCAPIRDVSEVVRDLQAAELGIFQTTTHSTIPNFRSVGLPLRFDDVRPPLRMSPPLVGADTDAVLDELGFSPVDIADLREGGAIQDHVVATSAG